MIDPRASMSLVFLLPCLLHAGASRAEELPVRYREGVSHGCLVLRTLEGKTIADGDRDRSHGETALLAACGSDLRMAPSTTKRRIFAARYIQALKRSCSTERSDISETDGNID